MEDALRRAAIPAWFTRGVIRPDSAGRSFLALLYCADEGLSASRFGEYLSHEQKEQPYGWERLLVDAAVIGGKDRWERRLSGLAVDAENRVTTSALGGVSTQYVDLFDKSRIPLHGPQPEL
jgi:hypothetical protein